jgi:hypothetical protein
MFTTLFAANAQTGSTRKQAECLQRIVPTAAIYLAYGRTGYVEDSNPLWLAQGIQ